RERPCPIEVLGLEQQDHFVRVVGSPQEVLLREARGGALGEVRVVAGLPAREVPDLVADEQIAWHGRSPFVLTWWRSRVRRSLDVPRIGRRGYLRQVAFTVTPSRRRPGSSGRRTPRGRPPRRTGRPARCPRGRASACSVNDPPRHHARD